MLNYKQRGDILTLPAAPYDLAPGDGCLVGLIFGVSANASVSGAECVLAVEGVYELPKVLTDGFTVGSAVYWDDGVKACTSTSSSHTKIGVAIAAAAANSTITVEVRLNESF